MKQIMIELCEFDNIPPCLEADKAECALARKWPFVIKLVFISGQAYECATMLSVEKKDIEEFERNIAVLKCYYDDFKGVIPDSEKKNACIGLYLLYLLSFNK